MKLSLGQAAKETGVSKATISRALKSGKLSGEKDGNQYKIDPAELFRVFPKDVSETPERNDPQPPAELEKDKEIIELRVKLEAAEKMLEEKDARIQDLRDAQKLLAAPKPGLLKRIFG